MPPPPPPPPPAPASSDAGGKTWKKQQNLKICQFRSLWKAVENTEQNNIIKIQN
jgi:hypothetical protein